MDHSVPEVRTNIARLVRGSADQGRYPGSQDGRFPHGIGSFSHDIPIPDTVSGSLGFNPTPQRHIPPMFAVAGRLQRVY